MQIFLHSYDRCDIGPIGSSRTRYLENNLFLCHEEGYTHDSYKWIQLAVEAKPIYMHSSRRKFYLFLLIPLLKLQLSLRPPHWYSDTRVVKSLYLLVTHSYSNHNTINTIRLLGSFAECSSRIRLLSMTLA